MKKCKLRGACGLSIFTKKAFDLGKFLYQLKFKLFIDLTINCGKQMFCVERQNRKMIKRNRFANVWSKIK